jgi:hypothetical protein
VDNFELSILHIKVDQAAGTATATVRATHEGKRRAETITLVREHGGWRISAVGGAA